MRCEPRATTAPLRDATISALVLAAAIYFGSGRLMHFDAALSGYCAATLVACWGICFQVSRFWRRRPSAFFGRTLIASLPRLRQWPRVTRRAGRNLAAQSFIAQRSRLRWLAHMLLSWGTLAGFAVTLPLVWGWLHFEAVDSRHYTVVIASLPVMRVDVDGVVGWLLFHALNLAAVAVIAGAGYFLTVRIRQRRETGVADRFHLAPLLLLLAVALTGLALPLAAQAGAPWLFRAVALTHEATVIVLLVALPYGKLLHVFIRPLHIGAHLARLNSVTDARCLSCGAVLAPRAQLDAVEATLKDAGFSFAGFQESCPKCRRRDLATAHTRVLGAHFQPRPAARRTPVQEAA